MLRYQLLVIERDWKSPLMQDQVAFLVQSERGIEFNRRFLIRKPLEENVVVPKTLPATVEFDPELAIVFDVNCSCIKRWYHSKSDTFYLIEPLIEVLS